MPRARAAWSSWNYHTHRDVPQRATVTYWMNSLQSLTTPEPLFVTLNRTADIDPRKILQRFTYHHPVYTPDAIRAQARHTEISGTGGVYYCGAYWGYGFHEDGVDSALAACAQIDPGIGGMRDA
jgi:predicted NAD/FAD-binding protein